MSRKFKLNEITINSFVTALDGRSGQTVKGGVESVRCEPTFTGQNTVCTAIACETATPGCSDPGSDWPGCTASIGPNCTFDGCTLTC